MAMEMILQEKVEEILRPSTSSTTMMPPATIQRIKNIVYESQGNQHVLQQAIGNALSTLGQPVMTTILWHLKAKGIILNSGCDIDIPMFHEALQQITGEFTEMIMNEICVNLDRACHDHTLVHVDPGAGKSELPGCAIVGLPLPLPSCL